MRGSLEELSTISCIPKRSASDGSGEGCAEEGVAAQDIASQPADVRAVVAVHGHEAQASTCTIYSYLPACVCCSGNSRLDPFFADRI